MYNNIILKIFMKFQMLLICMLTCIFSIQVENYSLKFQVKNQCRSVRCSYKLKCETIIFALFIILNIGNILNIENI